jgi:tungstate transport system ATP-binding protein
MMASTLFHIQGLRHRYGGHFVLEIPRLALEEGKIYALLGPNGSGKSTLLAILNRLLRPTQGEVWYGGQRIWPDGEDLLAVRRSMTLVLQRAYLFQGTVAFNVAYGLKVRGLDRGEIRQRVQWALREVGLSELALRSVRELSGGEAQRVALARALAVRPRTLLLDEATANVDEETVRLFEEVVRRINKREGVSVILATHDRLQAERLAHGVLVLSGGRPRWERRP